MQIWLIKKLNQKYPKNPKQSWFLKHQNYFNVLSLFSFYNTEFLTWLYEQERKLSKTKMLRCKCIIVTLCIYLSCPWSQKIYPPQSSYQDNQDNSITEILRFQQYVPIIVFTSEYKQRLDLL